MTERTVAKPSTSGDDDDSISITSTQESEVNEERSYVVDRILAEQDDGEGNIFYLVKWDGHHPLSSTWEPAENIESQAILDWNEEKIRIERGLSKEFDVAAFDEEVARLELARVERRQRRKAKRERLRLVAPLFNLEDETLIPVPNREDIQHNAKVDTVDKKLVDSQGCQVSLKPGERVPALTKSSGSRENVGTDEEVSGRHIAKKINLRRTQNDKSRQDNIIDTSEDSHVEELKQEGTRAKTRARGTGSANSKRATDVSVKQESLNYSRIC